MTQPVVVATPPPAAELVAGFERIRTAQHVPSGFPSEVEAAAVAADGRALHRDRVDHTGTGFVTLDPTGSRDLDQAFAIERRKSEGWRVFASIITSMRPQPRQPSTRNARIVSAWMRDSITGSKEKGKFSASRRADSQPPQAL